MTEDLKKALGALWGDDLLSVSFKDAEERAGEPVRFGLLIACAIAEISRCTKCGDKWHSGQCRKKGRAR